MSYGVKIDGKWAKSKKAIKEAMRENPERVTWVNTSIHGEFAECEFRGDLLPKIKDTFVGPDPYTDRKFYGSFEVRPQKVTIS